MPFFIFELMDLSFKKQERISKRDEIELLFKKGESFTLSPFRVLHLSTDKSETPLKLLVSVPKKKIAKAHLRNRLKRKIKEGYRLNRLPLKNQLTNSDTTVLIALVYQSEQDIDYFQLEHKISLILNRLLETYGQDN